ncbi:N-acetyltransferase DgcN [Salinimonas profundi]|nr:N-acetyltransferase DgcN [Salinimonas profundi]
MIQAPYLLFIGDATDPLSIKMARSVADWRAHKCLGEYRLSGCEVTTGCPSLSIAQAAERGAKSFILGFANSGGHLDERYLPHIIDAIESGMDIVSGLHDKLTNYPELVEKAEQAGVRLIDIRHPTLRLSTGTGKKRTGKRLLTVGTDCSVGKMYTSLSLVQAMSAQGRQATFRATGQSGILVAGEGIPIDCVVADFISGAAESLSPDNDPAHWDIIEGQGSLFHPAFAGVSLGLLHGSQPDALIVCHALNRTHMRGLPHVPQPSLKATIEANLNAAKLTNPDVYVAGIAVNTSAVGDSEAAQWCRKTSETFNLPCVDPVRHDVTALLENL